MNVIYNNSTDSESVDLIMKSIIFSFFEVHRLLFFFRSSNSVDDKLVSVVKKEANCEAELLKKLVDHLCLEIVGFFYQWIVFSGVTKLSIGHKIFIDHPLQ
jgi:hypothetical protein